MADSDEDKLPSLATRGRAGDDSDTPTSTRRCFLGSASAATLLGPLGAVGPAAGVARASKRTPTLDDPLGVRADFPIVDSGTYLNSACITPSPRQVVERGTEFLRAKAHDPVMLRPMLDETDAARAKFARLVGATQSEVGVLYATSDGENIVTRALNLQPGDNVVISDLHYETTFALYRRLEDSHGIELRIARNEHGAAPPEAFAALVDDRTRLISVSWVSHQNGYVHDLKALADLAHAHGAYLYADAIQGIGMLQIDVRQTGIDFLTAGTYKWLLGGYGVAPFYVREALLDRIDIDRSGSLNIARELPDHRYELHADGRKYGYATMSFGAVYQLSAALDYLHEVGVDRIESHTVGLAQAVRAGLADQGFAVWTPAGNRSAIVAFEHGGDPDTVRRQLDEAGIKASLRVDGGQIRVGVALFNNAADVARLLDLTGRWG